VNKNDLKVIDEAFPPYIKSKSIYIYGLTDPVTGEIRYIGKSIRPIERLANHCNEVSKCHRSNWIQGLRKQGLKPGMVILERINGDWPWQESEKYWISYGRKNGWDLVNNTNGGDGVSGLSGESKERMSKTWIGRKHRPDSIIKIIAAVSGRKHSNETKIKMSESHKGRNITWGDKLSESNRKLNNDDVNNINLLIKSNIKVKDIASIYNVHRTTISKIKKGVYFDKYRNKPSS